MFVGPEQTTAAPEQVSAGQVPTDAPPRTEEQVSTDIPPALTAWSSVVLAPILAELSVSRETIRDQAEQIGRQSAEIEALRAAQAPTVAPVPVRLLLARWWPVVAVLVALVVAGWLLAWPR